MLISYSIQKRVRTPVKTMLLVFLLAAACMVFCFSAAYSAYVKDNAARLTEAFTTIAIPDVEAITKESLPYYNTDYWKVSEVRSDLYVTLHNFINQSDLACLDDMELLRGVVSGAAPVLPRAPGQIRLSVTNDPMNRAAFIATLEKSEWLLPDIDDDFETFDFSLMGGYLGDNRYAGYKLTFRVDETVTLHPGFGNPDIIYVTNSIFNEAGELPFEIGKRYFIFGRYQLPMLKPAASNPHMLAIGEWIVDPDGFERVVMETVRDYRSVDDRFVSNDLDGETRKFRIFPDDALAQVVKPIGFGLDVFLEENPDTAEWLLYAQRSNASVFVRTVERLDSLVYFSQNKAWVADGREFTGEELRNGAPVALIHRDFAEANGLRVGDVITLDLYESRYVTGGNGSEDTYGAEASNFFRGAVEAEIIGVYTAPDYQNEPYGLPVNTVLIPSRAAPIAREGPLLPDSTAEFSYKDIDSPHTNPSLFTAVIENGRMDEFLEKAREAGVAKYFLTYDQGYTAVQEPMRRLVETARTMLFVSVALSAVIGFVLTVLALGERRELGLFLSLGVKPGPAVKRHAAGWAVLLIPALLIGFTATALSFDAMSGYTLTRVMEEDDDEQFSIGPGGEGAAQTLMEHFENKGYVPDITLYAGIILLVYLAVLTVAGALLTRQGAVKLLRRRE